MKAWQELARTTTPDGTDMTLCRRGDEFFILADGRDLMTSRMHGSEEALASLGCERAARRAEACVLVGGLGMGFTLRSALDVLREDATLIVSELIPAVVEWNEGPLGHLAGHPLDDPRVRVEVGDVADCLCRSVGRFDAVMLDVDNGPRPCAQASNGRLYDNSGVMIARDALRPEGVLAVWSAWPDAKFAQRLRHCGFEVEERSVRARGKKGGARHVVFLGLKRGTEA